VASGKSTKAVDEAVDVMLNEFGDRVSGSATVCLDGIGSHIGEVENGILNGLLE
jgi:hypothetical protein